MAWGKTLFWGGLFGDRLSWARLLPRGALRPSTNPITKSVPYFAFCTNTAKASWPVAQVCGLRPGDFVHTFGDAHLYSNHIDQARLQLTRKPKPLPMMHINQAVDDIFGFVYEDFALEGYDPHPHIKAEVSV